MNFFEALRAANLKRLPQFKNAKGKPAHTKDDGSDWSPLTWCNAALGEIGEASNFIKKMERGDISMEEGRIELGKELADVVTYLDILAAQFPGTSIGPTSKWLTPRDELLSEAMARIATPFGDLVEFCACEDGDAIEGVLRIIIEQLFMVADMAMIDLKSAVILKFNEVSARVNSTITLSNVNFTDDYMVVDDHVKIV